MDEIEAVLFAGLVPFLAFIYLKLVTPYSCVLPGIKVGFRYRQHLLSQSTFSSPLVASNEERSFARWDILKNPD